MDFANNTVIQADGGNFHSVTAPAATLQADVGISNRGYVPAERVIS